MSQPGLEGVQLLSDGRIAAWTRQGALQLWEASTGRAGPMLAASGIQKAVALPGSQLLLAEENGLRFWSPHDHRLGSPIRSGLGGVRGAKGLQDGRIVVWDYEGRLAILSSPDRGGKIGLRGHSQAIRGAQELPNSRLLSWSEDGTLRIWDLASGKLSRELRGHTRKVKGAALLSSGEILSWSSDQTLRIWNAVNGRCTAILTGHERGVVGAQEWRGQVVSWAGDGRLRIWGLPESNGDWPEREGGKAV